jgi:N-formylglutamate deformylase
VQIEINRRVYLDEDTREPNANFTTVQRHLRQLMAIVADYVRSQCRANVAHL